jgi:hypothetical protein
LSYDTSVSSDSFQSVVSIFLRKIYHSLLVYLNELSASDLISVSEQVSLSVDVSISEKVSVSDLNNFSKDLSFSADLSESDEFSLSNLFLNQFRYQKISLFQTEFLRYMTISYIKNRRKRRIIVKYTNGFVEQTKSFKKINK